MKNRKDLARTDQFLEPPIPEEIEGLVSHVLAGMAAYKPGKMMSA
jgi:hypothetical protein